MMVWSLRRNLMPSGPSFPSSMDTWQSSVFSILDIRSLGCLKRSGWLWASSWSQRILYWCSRQMARLTTPSGSLRSCMQGLQWCAPVVVARWFQSGMTGSSWPSFDIVTKSVVKNFHNEDQTITITDSNDSRRVATMQTHLCGPPKFHSQVGPSHQQEGF